MTFCSDNIYTQEDIDRDKTDEDKRFLLSSSLYKGTKLHIDSEAIALYPYTSNIVQAFAPKVNPVD